MLKIKPMITAGVLASCAGAAALGAGPPPLDRPSPPAYCADGVCRPNPVTFGWYQTRWRRWPAQPLEPTPAETPPEGRVPELPPAELPTKEEEDRAAPPRSKAAERAAEEEEEGATPPAGTESPTQMPFDQPPGGLQPRAPSREGGPQPPTMTMPWDLEPQAPATETTPGPLGDLDPPPALPVATPILVNGRAAHDAQRPKPLRESRRATPAEPRRTGDPPPTFPIAYLDQ